MRQYELMMILSPEIDERTIESSLKRYTTIVTDNGGTIEKLDVWGKRRLAYPINKYGEGIYVVVDMKATPEISAELDRQLSLNEFIMRTKLLRIEK